MMDHSPGFVTHGEKKKCEQLTPSDLSYCKASCQEATPEDENRKTEIPLDVPRSNKVIGINKNSSSLQEKGQKLSKRKLFSGQTMANGPGNENSIFEKKRKLEEKMKNTCLQTVSSSFIKPALTERQQLALLLAATSDQTNPECTTKDPSLSFTKIKSKKGKINTRIYRRNERGETPLHIAAIKDDVAGIKKLIKDGVDVQVKDYAGWTALHEACNHGNLSSVKILLERRAAVNDPGFEGDTPLHDAVINDHVEIVKMLLSYGANPYQSNTRGAAPVGLVRTEEMNKMFTSRGITTPFSLANQCNKGKIKEKASQSNHVQERVHNTSKGTVIATNMEENSRKDSENMKPEECKRGLKEQSDCQSLGAQNEIQRKDINQCEEKSRNDSMNNFVKTKLEEREDGCVLNVQNECQSWGSVHNEIQRKVGQVGENLRCNNSNNTMLQECQSGSVSKQQSTSCGWRSLGNRLDIQRKDSQDEENSRNNSKNTKIQDRKLETITKEKSRGSILRNEIQRKETQGESKMEKPVMYRCKLTPGECSEEIMVEMTTVNPGTFHHATEDVENPRPSAVSLKCSTDNTLDQKYGTVDVGANIAIVNQENYKVVDNNDSSTAEHSEATDYISSQAETVRNVFSTQVGLSKMTVSMISSNVAGSSCADEGSLAKSVVSIEQAVHTQKLKNDAVSTDQKSDEQEKWIQVSSRKKCGKNIDENVVSGVITDHETLRRPKYNSPTTEHVQSEVASQVSNFTYRKMTKNDELLYDSTVSKLTGNDSDRAKFMQKSSVTSKDDENAEIVPKVISRPGNVALNCAGDKSTAQYHVQNNTTRVRLVSEYEPPVRARKPSTTWTSLFARNKCNISELRIPFYDQFLVNTKHYELATSQETTAPEQTTVTSFKEMLILKQQKSKTDLTKKQKSELDKLQMCMEQEIVRLHTKKTYLTQERKTTPGVCDIIRWQNMTPQQLNIEKKKLFQKRFSAESNKILTTSEGTIVKKYEKLKTLMTTRHTHELQALDAVAKRELESLC